MNIKAIKNYYIRLWLSSLIFVFLGIVMFYLSEKFQSISLKNIFNVIASVLLISGVYNILYEFILKLNLISFIIEKINLKKSISDSGLIDIKHSTSDIDYKHLIKVSKHNIDIVHRYGDIWTKNNIEFIEEKCIEHDIDVRVILLSPESQFCEAIANHYNNTKEYMSNKIYKTANRWLSINKKLTGTKSKVSVYFHAGNPVHTIYRFDNIVVNTFYKITNDITKKVPVFICKNNNKNDNSIFNFYINEIDMIIENASKYS